MKVRTVKRATCLICGRAVQYLPSRSTWRHVTRPKRDDHAPLPGRLE